MRSRKTPYWLAPDQRRVVRRLRARGPGPTWFCDGNDAARPMLERAGLAARVHRRRQGSSARARRACRRAMAPAGRHHAGRVCRRRAPRSRRAAARGAATSRSARASRRISRRGSAREGCSGAPLVLVQAGNKRTMRRGLRRLAVNHKYWPNGALGRGACVYLRARCPAASHRASRHRARIRAQPRAHGAPRVSADVCNAADDLPIPRLIALLIASRRAHYRRLGTGACGRGGRLSASRAVRQGIARLVSAVGHGGRRRQGADAARSTESPACSGSTAEAA